MQTEPISKFSDQYIDQNFPDNQISDQNPIEFRGHAKIS